MSFLKEVRYAIIGFLAFGVLALIWQLFNNYDAEDRDNFEDVSFSLDETGINLPRLYLFAWEFVWLGVITVAFIWLAKNATKKANLNAEHRFEEFEGKFFRIMISILFIAAILTLALPAFIGDGLPQYNTSDEGIEVEVVAFQYGFFINGNLTHSENLAYSLDVDEKYIFKLTTLDTTHGFGLYDPDGILLTQSQITPEYTANLAFTFDERGLYSIQCMEYCGISHHIMIGYLEVS